MRRFSILSLLAAAVMLVIGTSAQADYYGKSKNRVYEVTITNLTLAQSFTPQLLVTHDRRASLFQAGESASLPLEILAEGGDTAPFTDLLNGLGSAVGEVQTVAGLLLPGTSVTTTIEANRFQRRFSLASMLIPTNDTFVAVNGIRLPHRGTRTVYALAYDAGTEANDQECLNMPGPRCGGEGHSPGPNAGDEGFIYVSNGFHSLPASTLEGGEVLGPQRYDWRNPVARIQVKRIR